MFLVLQCQLDLTWVTDLKRENTHRVDWGEKKKNISKGTQTDVRPLVSAVSTAALHSSLRRCQGVNWSQHASGNTRYLLPGPMSRGQRWGSNSVDWSGRWKKSGRFEGELTQVSVGVGWLAVHVFGLGGVIFIQLEHTDCCNTDLDPFLHCISSTKDVNATRPSESR